MSCSNCYNGCQEISSDKCVKYTGNDSAPLGIENGDSVNVVLEELIEKVVSFLNGSGIDISLNLASYCELVTKYLPACKPSCEPPTLVELLDALVKAACDLQTQVNAVDAAIDTLNADYNKGCLTGVTNSSDTHAIVQAIIDKLCVLNTDLTALLTSLPVNYVQVSEINDFIADYLASIGTSTKHYLKMVPNTVVEFWGDPDGKFDSTGKGFGDWEKINLCNGNNGTPDKRGRSPIGAISGMLGGFLDPEVDPALSPLNTNYAKGTKNGVNGVILSVSNLPSHTHTIQSSGAHTHEVIARSFDDTGSGTLVGGADDAINNGTATTSSNGAHTHVADPTGGGTAHANTHPVLACLYIMYVP